MNDQSLDFRVRVNCGKIVNNANGKLTTVTKMALLGERFRKVRDIW